MYDVINPTEVLPRPDGLVPQRYGSPAPILQQLQQLQQRQQDSRRRLPKCGKHLHSIDLTHVFCSEVCHFMISGTLRIP